MSRLRWPDLMNSASQIPGTIHIAYCPHVDRDRRTGRLRAGLGLVEVA